MLDKFSWLPAALRLVKGVLVVVFDTDPLGVDAEVESPPADFLAAFSASLFCFDAEGAMVVVNEGGR